MKAAMRPLPCNAVASPYAMPVAASGINGAHAEAASRVGARPQRERTEHARDQAAGDTEADLFQHQPHGFGVTATLGGRECQRDQQQRYAQAVIQPAFDVEALPYPRRDTLVGDDGLAESGIGR